MLNNLVMPVDNEIVPAALHMTTLPPLQWAIYFNCVHKFLVTHCNFVICWYIK